MAAGNNSNRLPTPPTTLGARDRTALFPAVDAVTALTVFLALQLGIPSSLRIPALGGIGYPAALWALCIGLWWSSARLRMGLFSASRNNPVKLASFALFAIVILSYAWAMHRPLPPVESTQADIAVARILVALSLVLIASDGIANWERFLTLLRRTSLAGGLLGALGLIQFVTNRSWTEWISIPGFSRSDDYSLIVARGGFTRAAGTALHPLEYGMALSVVFPIAVTLAIYDKERPAVVRWSPACIVLLALFLSGSRSGYIGLIIGIAALAVGWSGAIRLRIFAVLLGVTVLIFVTVPGMIGTIRGLFLFLDTDPSAQSRSDSYDLVWEFFTRSPLVGRGLGTLLPTYRILDNQILLILVELGLIGMVAFSALIACAVFGPWKARRRLPVGLSKQLGLAIPAGVLAGASFMLFFDAFAFPIAFGMWFLIVGLSGAYWNVARNSPATP
jgi:polysaccharide biosynthesis protein PslJ